MQVDARVSDNGTDTTVTIGGAGPGLHSGYIRVWPQELLVHFDFDGPDHALVIAGIGERCLAVVDTDEEHRFDVAPLPVPAPPRRSTGSSKVRSV